MTILVTGGAGFIGANFVLEWLRQGDEPVVTLDKLTYAGNLANLAAVTGDRRHRFVHGDIGDSGLIAQLLRDVNAGAKMHRRAGVKMHQAGHSELSCWNALGRLAIRLGLVRLDGGRLGWSGIGVWTA